MRNAGIQVCIGDKWKAYLKSAWWKLTGNRRRNWWSLRWQGWRTRALRSRPLHGDNGGVGRRGKERQHGRPVKDPTVKVQFPHQDNIWNTPRAHWICISDFASTTLCVYEIALSQRWNRWTRTTRSCANWLERCRQKTAKVILHQLTITFVSSEMKGATHGRQKMSISDSSHHLGLENRSQSLVRWPQSHSDVVLQHQYCAPHTALQGCCLDNQFLPGRSKMH